MTALRNAVIRSVLCLIFINFMHFMVKCIGVSLCSRFSLCGEKGFNGLPLRAQGHGEIFFYHEGHEENEGGTEEKNKLSV